MYEGQTGLITRITQGNVAFIKFKDDKELPFNYDSIKTFHKDFNEDLKNNQN
jgi:hypothetical protein